MRNLKWTCGGLLALSLATLGSGCSGVDADEATSTSDGDTDGGTGGSSGLTGDEWTTGTTGTSDSGGTDGGWTSGGGTGDGGGDSGGEPGDGTGGATPEPGQLTAGEWRDLDNWLFWLDVIQTADWKNFPTAWGFHTTNRFEIVVEDDQVPVADARVVLLGENDAVLWESRTDALGRAEAFAGLFGQSASGPYTIEVTSGSAVTAMQNMQPSATDPIVIELDQPAEPQNVLDLMFVIDTTGSMGDELSYLQAELADVIERVKTDAGNRLQLRLSVNFYRDEGDDYVVRSFPFTADVGTAVDQLLAQNADGGGDYPEAVEQGLADGVYGHDWSDSARSRLLFLVLDAPPHAEGDIPGTIRSTVEEAARQGIRIVPLAASGVDKSTEFLLRFMDISTGGTYTFLTNHSGIGGDHLEPSIGDYEVEYLNDLLVRVILESLG